MQTGGVPINLTLSTGDGSAVKSWMTASTGDLDATKVQSAGDINITLSDNIEVASSVAIGSLPTMTTDNPDADNDGNVDGGVFPCFFDFTDDRFKGKTITIDGGGHTIEIGHGSLFFLNLKACKVILKNITIDGGWEGLDDDGNDLGGIERSSSFIYVSQPTDAGESSELVIEEGTTIQNCKNSGDEQGGGIYNCYETVTMNGGTISGCSSCYGGGIYNCYGTVTMNGGTISGCSSSDDGGGIYSYCGTVTMNGGTISGCSSCYGGGIYNCYGTVTMNGGTISGCSSSDDGGGICSYEGPVTMNGGTISGCSSSDDGGGIYSCEGMVTMNASSITDCSAGARGDAIYSSGALKLPPGEFGFLTITLPTGHGSDAGGCDHNSNPEDVMGYEGICKKGEIILNLNKKIVFVDESNPPKQLNTGVVMGSICDYISVSNLNIMDGVRYVNKAGKETFVAVKDGKFQLTRDMIDAAKKGVITFKVKFGASASDTVKYVASGGHMILDKKSKLTNYSGVNLPIGGLRKVHEPKKVIFDFCGQTIHHNDPNVPFIQGVPGKHIVICNLKMDGSGCK